MGPSIEKSMFELPRSSVDNLERSKEASEPLRVKTPAKKETKKKTKIGQKGKSQGRQDIHYIPLNVQDVWRDEERP